MKKHGSPDGKTANPWFEKQEKKRNKQNKIAKKSRRRNRGS